MAFLYSLDSVGLELKERLELLKKRFLILVLAALLLVSFTAPYAQASRENGGGRKNKAKIHSKGQKHKQKQWKNGPCNC